MIDSPMLLVVTSQRNWSVVFSQDSVAFLENCRVGTEPSVRELVRSLQLPCSLEFLIHLFTDEMTLSKTLEIKLTIETGR